MLFLDPALHGGRPADLAEGPHRARGLGALPGQRRDAAAHLPPRRREPPRLALAGPAPGRATACSMPARSASRSCTRASSPGRTGERIYQPFPQAQIARADPAAAGHRAAPPIRPDRILGHGEVSPAYKEDPGPTFPWRRLAEPGITPPWPDAARVAAQRARFEALLPDVAWFQRALAQHGYAVETTGRMDEHDAARADELPDALPPRAATTACPTPRPRRCCTC